MRHLHDSQWGLLFFGGQGGGGCGTSLDTSIPARTSPLRGHLVLKVERDGARGSNGQLFTRCLPTNIDKKFTDGNARGSVLLKIRGRKRSREKGEKKNTPHSPIYGFILFLIWFRSMCLDRSPVDPVSLDCLNCLKCHTLVKEVPKKKKKSREMTEVNDVWKLEWWI